MRWVVVVARLTTVEEALFGPRTRVLVRFGHYVVDSQLIRLVGPLRPAELALVLGASLPLVTGLVLLAGLVVLLASSLVLAPGVLPLLAFGLPELLVAGVVLVTTGLLAAGRVAAGLLGPLLTARLLGLLPVVLLIGGVVLVAARLLLVTSGLATLLPAHLLLVTPGLLLTAAHGLSLSPAHGLSLPPAVLARLALLGHVTPTVVLELVLPRRLTGLVSGVPVRLLGLPVRSSRLAIAGLDRLPGDLALLALAGLAAHVVALLLVVLAGAHLLSILSTPALARPVLCLLPLMLLPSLALGLGSVLSLHLLALLTRLVLALLVLLTVLLVLASLVSLALLSVLLSLSLLAIVRLSIVVVCSGVVVVMHDGSRVRNPCRQWGSGPQIGRTPFSTGRPVPAELALPYPESGPDGASRRSELAE